MENVFSRWWTMRPCHTAAYGGETLNPIRRRIRNGQQRGRRRDQRGRHRRGLPSLAPLTRTPPEGPPPQGPLSQRIIASPDPGDAFASFPQRAA